jgi:hypothetical protein
VGDKVMVYFFKKFDVVSGEYRRSATDRLEHD